MTLLRGIVRNWLVCAALLALLMPLAAQAGFEDLENEVREIRLDNGLRILLLERHDVPVFSFWTYVNVGGADEEVGKTGIAHMFEHMAFKGTQELGTLDFKKEKKILEQMDDVYDLIQAERLKGVHGDAAKLAEWEAQFAALQDEADALVDNNAFGKLVESNGGVGMNAFTSADATQYFYSMPSNKLELWVKLESDRFIKPVMREFYKERGVILEERRMRIDSQPQGRLYEEWMAAAFIGHPYGQSLIGYRSDIETWSRRDAEEFYAKHYGAENLVIAVVGDVYYDELEKLAKKYFKDIPAGKGPVPIRTVEPKQLGERRIVIEDAAQPFMFIGYHIPAVTDPDSPAVEALADILGQGRSSRLYSQLVKEEQSALFVRSMTGLPGSRYPNLLTIIALPNKDIDPEQLERAIYMEVDRIREEGISPEELAGFKNRKRAEFINDLESNQGMAGQLCNAQMVLGNWRELFRVLDHYDALSTDDVQRAAESYLTRSNRTVGMIVTVDADS